MVSLNQCRLCLNDPNDESQIFPLDMEMTILELAGGGKVTVGDALKYISLEITVPSIETPKQAFNNDEDMDEEEEEREKSGEGKDHPEVPKSLCQECLDKLQSMYEFKYRCEENRDYLKNHVKELAEEREAAERAARQAIVDELEFDINNIDSLPDKLVLKTDLSKKRRPRQKKDPEQLTAQQLIRKRKKDDKNIIIADESQLDTAIYVRKVITTPEKSPEQRQHSSKRKSKHIVIVDIPVGEKVKAPKYDRNIRKKEPLCDFNESNNSEAEATSTSIDSAALKIEKLEEPAVHLMRDEEPVFEEEEEEEKPRRPKRTRK